MTMIREDRTWERAEPVAVHDTTDNIGGDHGTRALAILNRSAANMLVSITFQKGSSSTPDEYTRVLPILLGDKISGGGRWIRVNATGTTGGGTSGLAHETILTTGVGLAFTNQPANDGVEIVSSSAADTTQSITIYGTTTAVDTLVSETVALNGTTAVATVKTDWGLILGVELSASCAGTITVREASANQTITTLATTVLSKGVETVTFTSAYNVPPVIAANGATTKQVGLVGTDISGAALLDSQALAGATVTAMNSAFATVTKVLTGDVEATRTVTISNSSDLIALY